MAFILRITGNYRKLIELQLPQYFQVIKKLVHNMSPESISFSANSQFLHNNNRFNIITAVNSGFNIPDNLSR